MLIESLSEFMKQVSNKTYHVLTKSNDERSEELCGAIDILPPDYNDSNDITLNTCDEIDDINCVEFIKHK